MGVEDLLQKHSLLEADIKVIGDRVKNCNGQANIFVDNEFPGLEGKGIHCNQLVLMKIMLHL